MSTFPRTTPGRLRLALGLSLALLSGSVAGQQVPAPRTDTVTDAEQPAAPAYATGDGWIDDRLADIDAYAARYPDAFAAELERYAGVSRAYLAALTGQHGWRAGDAWFACLLGRAVEATCRAVVRARSQAGAEADWEAVAAGFEAGPGSPAYASVRLALADSYRRWDRPLQPDAALRRALRERGKAQAAD